MDLKVSASHKIAVLCYSHVTASQRLRKLFPFTGAAPRVLSADCSLLSCFFQGERKRGPLAQPALHGNIAVVQLHDMLDNREAESGPAFIPASVCVNPIKPFENPGKVLSRDTVTCVGN